MYRNEIKTRSSIVVLRRTRLVVSIKCHPPFLFRFGIDRSTPWQTKSEGSNPFLTFVFSFELEPTELQNSGTQKRRFNETATTFYVCADP